jgi:peptidoglycan/xylan/chitin deacetylase (PgdA/CDA1 family)
MTRTLIYHDIATPADREGVGFPGPAAARYKLTPAVFDAHLDAIAAAGVEVGLLQPGASGPAAAMSFDDGGASALLAAGALERRGWRGHFFVVSGRVGTPGFLTADGVRDLAARGHVIGSHSRTHPAKMAALDRAAAADEWRRSRSDLGALLGSPPALAAVPGGSVSRAVYAAAAAAGYRVLMTSTPLARDRTVDGMTVSGRYAVWAATPPERVAAYACGALAPRVRLRAGHEAKRIARSVSPSVYDAARRARARSARG